MLGLGRWGGCLRLLGFVLLLDERAPVFFPVKVVSATNHFILLFQFQNKRKHIESCELCLCFREGLGDLVAEMLRLLGGALSSGLQGPEPLKCKVGGFSYIYRIAREEWLLNGLAPNLLCILE